MIIVPILEPTKESEARLKELEELEGLDLLTREEEMEKFSLEMRQFWNCEC